MNIQESDFADHFIRIYVNEIKRGIGQLHNKEEYKDGFRIIIKVLEDNFKRQLINNKNY